MKLLPATTEDSAAIFDLQRCAYQTEAELYNEFAKGGFIKTEPVAVNEDLAPDASTPVLVNGKLFGCWNSLYCLDVDSALAELWCGEDDAYGDYASVIASPERVLVITAQGELLLVDATAAEYTIVSRLQVFAEGTNVLSHPALSGNRLFVRDMTRIVCVDLSHED
ncbi:MAG: hypothetical protein U1E05_08445 [Patescibacteria group bacterium]|nr:hypothetical protein [Patescibacteria group bacterium]